MFPARSLASEARLFASPDVLEEARLSQKYDCTKSFGTPEPFEYIKPRLYWAAAYPCSAAFRYHLIILWDTLAVGIHDPELALGFHVSRVCLIAEDLDVR